MSFFEPPPPPPSLYLAEAEYRQPAWLGPPANVLPGVVPVELLIARTDEAAVAVTGIRAYPTGFALTLSLRLRRRSARLQEQFFDPFNVPFAGDQIPDDFLRFGVQFADGRKATNLPRYDLHHDTEPDPPVLTASGGGGGGSAWDMDQWVWPLPPAGLLAFVCEWPARQIAQSRVELDARSILQAAERATTLWPDD